MIRFENVSRTFGRDDGSTFFAVHDLTLDVREGETLALVGPSGCGKTTTLRLLNRLIEPTGGRILLGGEDTAGFDAVRLRRRMGYVVQSGGLFPHLTAARNIGLLAELERWPRDRIDARVTELLELVRLPAAEFQHRYPHELSGGQRQRVGVARALTLDPDILLMDEPFGALDPLTRAGLQQEFKDLERLVQKTIVLVSHDLHEATLLGDRIALLNEGELVQVDTPDELKRAPATPWVESFLFGRHEAAAR